MVSLRTIRLLLIRRFQILLQELPYQAIGVSAAMGLHCAYRAPFAHPYLLTTTPVCRLSGPGDVYRSRDRYDAVNEPGEMTGRDWTITGLQTYPFSPHGEDAGNLGWFYSVPTSPFLFVTGCH